MTNLLQKLSFIVERFDEVAKLIVDPEIITDMKRYAKLMKEYKDLGVIVEAHKEYKGVIDNIASTKEMLESEDDDDFKAMAKAELDALEARKEEMDEEVKMLLVPKDPDDDKNVVMEIRAGTGGDEASIFAGDLFRMYSKFISDRGWKTEIVDYSEGTSGGYKEIIFSAASVVVMPEADEFDVVIKTEDIRRDEFCSSGPGGQSVNTTYSAIRLTHIPTGIVAQCQDQKSKLKNYDKALAVLRSRVYEVELQKRLEEETKTRRSMVASGDRSDKIRTYNYPQGRVTDHRIGLTLYDLPKIIGGDLGGIVDALRVAENAEKLKAGEALTQ